LEHSPSKPNLSLALKALADDNRLKILGLLSQNPHTGEQLATLLNLRPSTISHHLSRLRQAGLVSAKAVSYYSVYHLEADSLAAIAHQLASGVLLGQMADAVYEDAHTRLRSTARRRRSRKPKATRCYRPRRKS
jgi:DNA-binding transcriptional ArsR family regulator